MTALQAMKFVLLDIICDEVIVYLNDIIAFGTGFQGIMGVVCMEFVHLCTYKAKFTNTKKT